MKVERQEARPGEVLLGCPFEPTEAGAERAAAAAVLAEVPPGSELVPLEMPVACYAHRLSTGVRIVKSFSAFPKQGLPREIGYAHVAYKV